MTDEQRRQLGVSRDWVEQRLRMWEAEVQTAGEDLRAAKRVRDAAEEKVVLHSGRFNQAVAECESLRRELAAAS